MLTLAGCSTAAGLWFWYSGMAETAPDYKTCIAMIGLPLGLMVFRPLVDRGLRPLQAVLGRIPRFVRLGIGLAIPFLVAHYLYAKGFFKGADGCKGGYKGGCGHPVAV